MADALTWTFLIVPHFALISGLGNLNTLNSAVSVSEGNCQRFFVDLNAVFYAFQFCTSTCDIFPGCTSIEQLCNVGSLGDICCDTDYYQWGDPGILRNIVFMVIAGLLYMAILFMIEFRVFHSIFYCLKPVPKGLSSTSSAADANACDSDVLMEKYRVRNMNFNQVRSNNLVVKNMTKFYKNFLAVNQICVGVDA